MSFPKPKPIKRFRGDTQTLMMTLKNKDGTAFDLTGKTFMLSAILPKKKGTTEYILQSPGVIVGDPADGALSFDFTDEQVAVAGAYEYDVEMTTVATGKGQTIAHGTFDLVVDVTQ